jgi:hypothetical protein
MAITLLFLLFGLLIIPLTVLAVSNIKLWIEFKGLQNSTHRLTYINPLSDEPMRNLTEEQKESLTKEPFDNLM